MKCRGILLRVADVSEKLLKTKTIGQPALIPIAEQLKTLLTSSLLHNNFLSEIIVVYALIENSFVQDFLLLVCCILCSRRNKQTNNRVCYLFSGFLDYSAQIVFCKAEKFWNFIKSFSRFLIVSDFFLFWIFSLIFPESSKIFQRNFEDIS